MKEPAERICDLLNRGRPAAVATILSREGSAPRTAGSKIVVDDCGEFSGTIGGGKFEADVLAEAKNVLAAGRPRQLFFDLTRDDVSAMDMICGGHMTVLVDCIAPTQKAAAVFGAWKEALEKPVSGALVTVATGSGGIPDKTDHCMVYADGRITGDWPLSDPLLRRVAEAAEQNTVPRVMEAEAALILVEPVPAPKTLVLFGAGHVSMPTARMAADVGFRVVVVDDRSAFANRDRFPEAREILVPEEFVSVFSELSVDPGTSVVILTRGHRHDKEVLSKVLRTRAGYIGMIGSRRKRDAIYSALRNEGFADADFARVHCPVGLSIGAETPAEIAVSIVAELIAHWSETVK